MKKPWIANWITEKHDQIEDYTVVNDNLVKLKRKNKNYILLYNISESNVGMDDINKIVSQNDKIDFIFNTVKDAYYEGNVLNYCEQNQIGIGNTSDLFSALNMDNPSQYIDKGAQFILPGLRQHTKVNEVIRLNNKTYYIERILLKPVKVLALNEYELNATAVRNGVKTYGKPDIILSSNPNGRISTKANEAAKSIGLDIISWGELLKELNFQ